MLRLFEKGPFFSILFNFENSCTFLNCFPLSIFVTIMLCSNFAQAFARRSATLKNFNFCYPIVVRRQHSCNDFRVCFANTTAFFKFVLNFFFVLSLFRTIRIVLLKPLQPLEILQFLLVILFCLEKKQNFMRFLGHFCVCKLFYCLWFDFSWFLWIVSVLFLFLFRFIGQNFNWQRIFWSAVVCALDFFVSEKKKATLSMEIFVCLAKMKIF